MNWYKKQGIRTRIIALMFVAILPIAILIRSYMLPTFEEKFYQNKKDTTRIAVEVAVGLIDKSYNEFKNGKLSEGDAKTQALQTIRTLRYNSTEYFWINDVHPTMIMHPIKAELEGKDLSDMKDPNGKFLFNEMAEIAQINGAGFVEYMWSKPGNSIPVKKISYVKEFKPWGWIIGNGVYVDDVATEMHTLSVKILIVFGLTLLMATILIISFSNYLTKKLLLISEQVFEGSQNFKNTSEDIKISSKNISNNTNSSSSALQETAASLEEISCMIKKSVDNSEELNKISNNSKLNVENGKNAVQEMLNLMNGIIANNKVIALEINNSNKEMEQVVTMIKEISNKTKVINDIVFQTKLLSFNASVEAARAGENGKGFAVVAEEIGILATKSGESSQEISTILNKSTLQVVEMVEKNKLKMDQLLNSTFKNLEQGLSNANRCGDSLNLIVEDSTTVNLMVNEISAAFKEQASGVYQITKAMEDLDLVTQKNAASAIENSNSSDVLLKDALLMESVTNELIKIVSGQSDKENSHT
jgi:methyl-accepting chemotaxis protein